MIKRRTFATGLLGLAGATLFPAGLIARAATPAAEPLSPPTPASAKAEIARAEAYLNQITTLEAHFLQAAPDGNTSEGTLFLSRPGRMRLQYDPPSPILVVANSGTLTYYDSQLQEVSYVALDSTMAGVLVAPSVQLDSGKLKVVRVGHEPGLVSIAVTQRDDPSQGQITLVFTESPYALKQWQVIDPQRQTTTVSLYQAQTGLALDDGLFRFTDPRPARNLRK